MVEKLLLTEEQREEKNYPPRSQKFVAFFIQFKSILLRKKNCLKK